MKFICFFETGEVECSTTLLRTSPDWNELDWTRGSSDAATAASAIVGQQNLRVRVEKISPKVNRTEHAMQ